MFLHIHDGVQVAYSHECPVCAPILEADPSAIITGTAEAVEIDG